MLVFGASRLPGVAKALGQSLKIFKNEIKDLRDDTSLTSDAPAPAPTPTPVLEAQPVVTQPAAPAEPTAPPVRIVTHEGVVRGVVSPVAPTKYELYDPATDVNINYLYTTSPTLELSHYVNMRIIVTGEEGLDVRWKDTPLINIQSIQVISKNAVPHVIFRSPRQSQGH